MKTTTKSHPAVKYILSVRVQISYDRFNNLPELLNRDITTIIGWGILPCDLMYGDCSLPPKGNVKCVYKGK